MNTNDLTHLDLFSGIGGFALAAQSAGFRTIGFSEVEPYACRVLAEKFPDVPNLGDVRKRAAFAGARGCTLLTGGYPCQPFSLAGKRAGEKDHRHLWPAMRDLFEDLRPTWGLCENVASHVTLGLDQVLSDLESLGYSTQSLVVPACAVDAWHRRDRVWIISHRDGGRREEQRQPEHVDEQSASGRQPHGLHPSGRRHGSAASDNGGIGLQESESVRITTGLDAVGCADKWPAEPAVGRMVHGLPNGTHRRHALGNAIVPPLAKVFIDFIAQIESGEVTA